MGLLCNLFTFGLGFWVGQKYNGSDFVHVDANGDTNGNSDTFIQMKNNKLIVGQFPLVEFSNGTLSLANAIDIKLKESDPKKDD